LKNLLDTFNHENRRPTKDALTLIALYDLFPAADGTASFGWPAPWPGADDCGVYVFMNANHDVLCRQGVDEQFDRLAAGRVLLLHR
jgi:hypothetical protein